VTLHFLDTNILIYSVDPDAAHQEKRARAAALLEEDGGALSVQVLQEFYAQATRPSRSWTLAHDLAIGFIQSWSRFEVQPMTMEILFAALELRTRTNFSYWDCSVIAAARALGCATLYSEDLSHGRIIDGVQIINPFRD
jgi:predicted nucleic acid-binding protein